MDILCRGGELLIIMALAFLAVCCRADIAPDVVQRAKQATVFVEVEEKEGIAEGSAFCIDATGLFVTNAHVVEALAVGGKLTLVLRSGEKDQIKFTAHVLALDKEVDLALLQADHPPKLTTLTLGNSEGLLETTSVVAFGYPFGTDLAAKEGNAPSITVSTGHITALRKVNGVLTDIQLDASLNPGNSGGPILDMKGNVIGIVKKGIRGSGINYAIPVNDLRTLIARPRRLVTPPVVQSAAPLPRSKGRMGDELLVSCLDSNDIRRFDAHTGAYLGDFAVGNGLQAPGAMEFGPDGNLYVCSTGSHEVKRYDGRTGAFIDNIVKAKSGELDSPLGLMFALDGKIYVGDKTNHIKRFDGKTGAFLDAFIGGNGMVYPGRMLYRR